MKTFAARHEEGVIGGRLTLSTLRPAFFAFVIGLLFFRNIATADDLSEVKKKGFIRHLGIPYANFVTGSGDGMDVELIVLFAKHLGVKYEFVKSDWPFVIGDLTGKEVKVKGEDIEVIREVPVKGDLIANGMTVIPWREKAVDFSVATFPTQIWLVARADFPAKPIQATGSIKEDIELTKKLLAGHSLLGMVGTCLDPSFYDLENTRADIRLYNGSLNEMAPAIINGQAKLTLLDVPDALVALQKWPGKIKVLGPISETQEMAVAFSKDSPNLRQAFNQFFEKCKRDGVYLRIVKKYYQPVLKYYPNFFNGLR